MMLLNGYLWSCDYPNDRFLVFLSMAVFVECDVLDFPLSLYFFEHWMAIE